MRDASVAAWMAARAKLDDASRVLEIGPGSGVLTRALLATPLASLDAIELDRRLARSLAELALDPRMTLYWGDAVTFDLSALGAAPTHVIANLPYHITTPVIWHLLEELPRRGTRYMLLMTQREAADRITAGAGARASCPLGITIAAMGSARVGRRVPRGAFTPMPRVDSAIVEIVLSGERTELPRSESWRRLLAGAFGLRRKTLANSLAASCSASRDDIAALLADRGLPSTLRAEEVPLELWLDLAADERLMLYLNR